MDKLCVVASHRHILFFFHSRQAPRSNGSWRVQSPQLNPQPNNDPRAGAAAAAQPSPAIGMGTREVYEEKLRSGAHLHRDPTINPGLGSPRCPRCFSLLNPTAGERDWAITSVLHDATAVVSSSYLFGFGIGLVGIQKHVKGPKWLQLLVGVPPLLMFSGASAVFGAYALPRFAQLTVTSYYAASTGSQYTASQITRQIERAHFQESDEKSR
ncbi:unnamed protein product [Miscanthus lutarioriparius]|uniref:Uncharacterized protein n=1 Tax=Miscanthus lutarioriparius TaxID=422564 RepID=A0A811SGW2_9POAL|nr:unnamed protein product [Miscanthus lutarioriparius]